MRLHPKTGEKALYVDYVYARGIEGMTDSEAEDLLGFRREMYRTTVLGEAPR